MLAPYRGFDPLPSTRVQTGVGDVCHISHLLALQDIKQPRDTQSHQNLAVRIIMGFGNCVMIFGKEASCRRWASLALIPLGLLGALRVPASLHTGKTCPGPIILTCSIVFCGGPPPRPVDWIRAYLRLWLKAAAAGEAKRCDTTESWGEAMGVGGGYKWRFPLAEIGLPQRGS